MVFTTCKARRPGQQCLPYLLGLEIDGGPDNGAGQLVPAVGDVTFGHQLVKVLDLLNNIAHNSVSVVNNPHMLRRAWKETPAERNHVLYREM